MSSPAICLAADCGQWEPWQVALLVISAFAVVGVIGLCVALAQRWWGRR